MASWICLSIYRVSDKMVKKPPPNFIKKNQVTSHHSTTLSPQPLQSERSFLHDKVQEKMKAKSPDKREKEFISLPEVKGAEGLSQFIVIVNLCMNLFKYQQIF